MRIAYFDCIAGASGDMILGALVDAGLPIETLIEQLSALDLEGFELNSRKVLKNGIQATKVDVRIPGDIPERRLPEIQAVLDRSDLPVRLKERSQAIFQRLGQVEAGIHGMDLEKVHLHELGGLDSIVDVVGTLAGLEALGIEDMVVSPLPLGRGFVKSAHGQLPLPAPATVELLQGIPVLGSEMDLELVTPTGAVLLSSLAASFGPIPPMILRSVGYGAGGRDLPIPNVLRILIGDRSTPDSATIETLALLETNIDDLNPQVYDYLVTRLFKTGALDVTLAPVQMKKNRPAIQIQVLCRPEATDTLSQIIFLETSTLGIRKHFVERRALERSITSVDTPYGIVRVKVAELENGKIKFSPEYEDCLHLAEASGVPLQDVFHSAERSAENKLSNA